MNANVGSLDKIIRLILAAVFFSLFFVLQGDLKWIALIGIVPLVTALAGWCPLYSIFGIKTCKMR
ncbi:DUF2892 domain-containing protein [Noviherbaspirillum sp. UKPF54]|uniref:YgaP family membrane protein n=1 Tax=Noviherbaspirillum sp. UKPF54 TaxID=2601898 RepID=UPI0011B11A97|nr:DUF2892 domain-containing protein [Noviherbaspirillum sp. UKPF54]QDZ27448.1 DUF2892 domain-containing protein [Noviherbaspirillum sp. UKPF54]